MTEDPIARMLRRMMEELQGSQQRVLGVFTEELQEMINAALRDMIDPGKLMGFIRAMGFDPSQLPGMMSQQPSFDPYQILGLDKSAPDEEVKKRYRAFAFKLHPDTAGTPGTDFLLNIVLAAYEMIKKQRGWE